MGSLLRDVEIEGLLKANPPIIDGFDPAKLGTEKSPVKGSSLDLTIGDIFVPGVASKKIGGLNKPRSELSLECGQTAVLRSAEKLRIPKNVAGIGFPPSTKVSLAGLLSTNPGHIDPDYCGHVHLTVVNMGKEPFSLESGKRLMRVLLFRLGGDASYPVGEPKAPLNEQLLNRLSHDFLDIDARARKAAKAEELRLRSWQVWGSIIVALVTAAVTGGLALGYQIYTGQKEVTAQLAKMQGKVDTLGGSLNVATFDEAVKEIKTIEERLKAIESANRKTNLPQPQ